MLFRSHLNPDANAVPKAVAELIPYLRAGQILILRSTLFPGVTASVERLLRRAGLAVDVAFCPERIAEGRAMVELFSLPQIVAARNGATRARAARLFRALTPTIVDLEPEEAELAKLFTNAWRYIRFAAANQLYMMANDFDLDYERIRQALSYDYPRAADLPSAGFAAGPCLFKDTMQLAAFNDNKFLLGHSAMMINEGMPLYVVSRVKERFPDLASKTVGILGMAFKGDSDDTRSSLAFKLRRILKFAAGDVVCADDNVRGDPRLVSEVELLKKAEIVIIAAPHSRYRDLRFDVPVIDIWALRGEGGRV